MWDFPLARVWADKVYVSCIFQKNRYKCIEWENDPKAIIGGSGYDIKSMLPPEIDRIKPKINIGFTTRGCIRKCSFCIVPEKEGKIKVVGDIYDFWDGKAKSIRILDNNILAVPEHFFKICDQIDKERLIVDFNQGIDIRLVDNDIAHRLLHIKHDKEIRFAFDNISDKTIIKQKLDMLQSLGLKDYQARFYVYVSPKNTMENVIDRIKLIQYYKQLFYVMFDDKCENTKEMQFLRTYSFVVMNHKWFKHYKNIFLKYYEFNSV